MLGDMGVGICATDAAVSAHVPFQKSKVAACNLSRCLAEQFMCMHLSCFDGLTETLIPDEHVASI